MGVQQKIEVEVADVHSSAMPSEAFSLILKEKEGKRYVPIIIGMNEARSIIMELNKMKPRRPMPHDLFLSLADYCGCSVVEVDIVHYEDGVFFADILVKHADDSISFHDSRTSDAVVIALKSYSPIFFDTAVFNESCVAEEFQHDMEQDNPPISSENIDIQNDEQNIISDAYIDQKLKELPNKELQSLLEGAVESEDYELAAKIQDEINRRLL